MNVGPVSIKYENANIDLGGTEEERKDSADYLNLIKCSQRCLNIYI